FIRQTTLHTQYSNLVLPSDDGYSPSPLFFLTSPAPPEIYTLSLHDALPILVDVFFPLHWALRRARPLQTLLSRVSPCLVYCHIYPGLTREQHEDWCRLDTYDALTDRYKRMRTPGQILRTLAALGGTQIQAARRGNGVEASCRKPPC